jgi:hypothetical protein
MKRLILLSLITTCALAQSTTLFSWNFPALGQNDSPITVNETYDRSVAKWNLFFQSQQLGGVASTTITSSVISTTTAIPVASITGLAVGNGICFAATCTSIASTTGTGPYTFTWTPIEVAYISAITPGTAPAGTLTVVRGSIGTAAAYASGQAVSFMAYGNLTQFALSYYLNASAQAVTNPSYGSKAAATWQAAVTAANAALAAAANTH